MTLKSKNKAFRSTSGPKQLILIRLTSTGAHLREDMASMSVDGSGMIDALELEKEKHLQNASLGGARKRTEKVGVVPFIRCRCHCIPLWVVLPPLQR